MNLTSLEDRIRIPLRKFNNILRDEFRLEHVRDIVLEHPRISSIVEGGVVILSESGLKDDVEFRFVG